MRQSRRVHLVPALLVVVFLLAGAQVVEDIIVPEPCANVICPRVKSGEMSWWTALLVWGCYCDQQEQSVTRVAKAAPVSCKPARMVVFGGR